MTTNMETNRPLKILTWHIHGSYLYYLSHAPCEFYLPVTPDKKQGYSGRSGPFPWGDNVREIPAEQVRDMDFDCIVFQSRQNYLTDQHEILTSAQRQLPRIYIEHDPPRDVPTDTRHIVDDPEVLLVHVTHFNELMWDSNRTPTKVIRHGVTVPESARYTGELDRGVVVINNIALRGRRLGLDVFKEVRKRVPLDVVGMGSKEVGGLGEVPPPELPDFIAKYRFFFNPIRYTSLGLAVCEAMMVGLPIIGLATTEMPVAVENNMSGYVHTDIDQLVKKMQQLLQDPEEARRLGAGARRRALDQFHVARFANDWQQTFQQVAAQADNAPVAAERVR